MTLPFLTTLIERQAAPSPVQVATGWYPLPGGRLELRDTGFVIHLCGLPRCNAFHMIDPGGRCLASSDLLQPLKQLAEQCAADRAEFRA